MLLICSGLKLQNCNKKSYYSTKKAAETQAASCRAENCRPACAAFSAVLARIVPVFHRKRNALNRLRICKERAGRAPAFFYISAIATHPGYNNVTAWLALRKPARAFLGPRPESTPVQSAVDREKYAPLIERSTHR
jgi:hypothetical protein